MKRFEDVCLGAVLGAISLLIVSVCVLGVVEMTIATIKGG